MSRAPRKGEYTCTCPAYRFPHRFGGGRCSGMWLVWQEFVHFNEIRMKK